MSITINNINKCKALSKTDKKRLLTKLDINKDVNDINVCNIIQNKYNKLNPCNMTLHKNTNLNIKKHQLSVANHLYNNKGCIVVHSVGTGKTLTAVSTAQCLLINNIVKKVIVITPTSLQFNFKSQMEMYGLGEDDFKKYHFYTIQKLVYDLDNGEAISATNSLIIIDEAHNLRALNGTRFDEIYKYSKKAEKILLLTATPIINYSYDIINLISLIRGTEPITIEYFNRMIMDKSLKKEMKEYLSDVFSFYSRDEDKPDINFPKKKILEIFLPMDKEYLKLYEKVEQNKFNKGPFKDIDTLSFYSGVRMASNVIEKYSPKINWIIDKLRKNKDEKFILYSSFINMGIQPIMNYLNDKNISYVIVSGEQNINERKIAVEKFNTDTVKIMFITKGGSEGLDLKRVNNIIIMEPAWNEALISQVIGRGVRYKSHIDLPKSKQIVYIYKLYCIKPIEYKHLEKITKKYLLNYNNNKLSVDLYLRNYSLIKQFKIINFYKILNKYGI